MNGLLHRNRQPLHALLGRLHRQLTLHQRSITKTDNAPARRLLTEAAWNYRFPARISNELRNRSKARPAGIRTHAWKAQVRLCSRFAHLSGRGVQANKVCVAVARELAGFVWAIAQQAAPATSTQ